jgi:uncharacterized membrane protein
MHTQNISVLIGKLLGLIALIGALGCGSSDSDRGAAIIEPLGALAGAPGACSPGKINNNGVVVGGCGNGDATERFFIWSRAEGMRLLSAELTGGIRDGVMDINDRGEVVGWVDAAAGTADWASHPFVIREGVLQRLLQGEKAGVAAAINNRWFDGTFEDPGQFGFLYLAGAFTDLGELQPNEINDAGVIVGSIVNQSTYEAAALSPSGLVKLGTFGGPQSAAADINNAGTAVGWADTPESYVCVRSICYKARAFKWSAAEGRVDLGALFDQGHISRATAINGAGHIIGWHGLPGEQGRAFIYTDKGGVHELDEYLPSGSGWELVEAADINDRDEVVGMGLYRGEARAFLLELGGLIQ